MGMRAQRIQELAEILRQGCRPPARFRSLRMGEFEMACVQGLTGKPGQGSARAIPACPDFFPVHWIADHRESEMGHVYADLVGSSGFKPCLEQRARSQALADPVVRDGRFSARAHGHLLAVDRVPAHRGIDHTARDDLTVHQHGIPSAHLALLQLLDQRTVTLQLPGDEQQSAGVLVEAVHDARPRDGGQAGIIVEQRIGQGACGIAGTGMHHQPRGLVDDQQGPVFIDDFEIDLLGQKRALLVQTYAPLDSLAPGYDVARA